MCFRIFSHETDCNTVTVSLNDQLQSDKNRAVFERGTFLLYAYLTTKDNALNNTLPEDQREVNWKMNINWSSPHCFT